MAQSKSRMAPAVLTFVIVAVLVFVVLRLADALLRNVGIPLIAIIFGLLAARVVLKGPSRR
jgi:small neutral amino acid transporter SnatA (MarC family)